MLYTVKQFADLAGVTRRTLHYYDEIGLLRPSEIADNGYRYYDDNALLVMQQILFYRELGQAYEMEPAFAARFAVMHPDLPAFLNQAIALYCQKLYKSNRRTGEDDPPQIRKSVSILPCLRFSIPCRR